MWEGPLRPDVFQRSCGAKAAPTLGQENRPTIGTAESHYRSFFEFSRFRSDDVNSWTIWCYNFVWSRGTAIAIASTDYKDFESD